MLQISLPFNHSATAQVSLLLHTLFFLILHFLTQKEDEIHQHEDNEDEDGQVEGDENHRPLSEHDEEEEEEEDEDTLEEKRESGDGQVLFQVSLKYSM